MWGRDERGGAVSARAPQARSLPRGVQRHAPQRKFENLAPKWLILRVSFCPKFVFDFIVAKRRFEHCPFVCLFVCVLSDSSCLQDCLLFALPNTTSGWTSGTTSSCTSGYYFRLHFRIISIISGSTSGYYFKVKRV